MKLQIFYIMIFSILSASCTCTPNIELRHDFHPSDLKHNRGVVVMSIISALPPINPIPTLYFTNSTSKDVIAVAGYLGKSSDKQLRRDYLYNSDFIKNNPRGKYIDMMVGRDQIIGRVIALDLEAGNYTLIRIIAGNTESITVPNISFSVEAGQFIYIGNFLYSSGLPPKSWFPIRHKISYRLIVRDKLSEDLLELKKHWPYFPITRIKKSLAVR